MRIVIEHDTSRNATAIEHTPDIPPATSGEVEAQPGGAGPSSGDGTTQGASSTTPGGVDAGGPPQWLLDALREAQTAAGEATAGRLADVEDGGAGLSAGATARQGERT